MRMLSRLAVMFYVTMTMFLGVIVFLFATHGISFIYRFSYGDVEPFLREAFFDQQARIYIGGAALLVLFLNYIFMKAISDSSERERTIAFDNPSGRVTVSLQALEDLTRRVIMGMPEVKEVRSFIRADNKGLKIDANLVLKADVNIPELTAKLQNLVKGKMQDTIGIDEIPTVRIHVTKISPEARGAKGTKKEPVQPVEEPVVPFQGYRA
jgi:uncharacterized alkaline shock family protein YloU